MRTRPFAVVLAGVLVVLMLPHVVWADPPEELRNAIRSALEKIEEAEAADAGPARELLAGLFGPTRRLYKRLAQYSFFQQRELYEIKKNAAYFK